MKNRDEAAMRHERLHREREEPRRCACGAETTPEARPLGVGWTMAIADDWLVPVCPACMDVWKEKERNGQK